MLCPFFDMYYELFSKKQSCCQYCQIVNNAHLIRPENAQNKLENLVIQQ